MEQINEQHPHRGDWLREIVFGLNDGLVTTLVFIMAVSAAVPTHLVLVVLGEVLAGGVSMGLGGYLSARTAKEVRWHQAMVHDELGVVEDKPIIPWLQGLQVGLSFVIGGLIPTMPVLLSLPQVRWWAYGLTAL